MNLRRLALAAVLCLPAAPLDAARQFALATAPRPISFPADHAAHPEYRAEWWYYTGILRDREARAFGFELTFFRVALAPELRNRASLWAARDVLFAHFAITDVRADRFTYAEKTGRPVLGLAGFSERRMRTFIGDWSAEWTGKGFRLRARRGGEAADLALAPMRPPVLNGDRGLSVKGPGRGNANFYYSIPRLKTAGTLTVAGKRYEVTGMTWMDHEWGTSALAPNQRGWDWFSLRLSDGRDLMLYSLRDSTGRPTGHSSGTLVQPRGSTVRLGPKDFRLTATGSWTSPRTRARYPSGWRVSLPKQGIDLSVAPLTRDQELVTGGTAGVTYWEGAVKAAGRSGGKQVTGEGYVELTGYAGRAVPR